MRKRAGSLDRTARPTSPGRLLEPVSNAGPRGMVVAPRAPQGGRRRTEFGLRLGCGGLSIQL